MHGLAGIVLIVGSALFLAGAFMPVSWVYAESDPQRQVSIVRDSPTQWIASLILFASGAAIAATGIALFAYSLHRVDSQPSLVAPAAYAAAALAGIGVGFWLADLYQRFTLTPEALFVDGQLGWWVFPVFTVLTQIALLLVGFALLRAGFPGWMGWGLLGAVTLTIVMLAVARDLPPLVHYVWMLILGIMLVRLD